MDTAIVTIYCVTDDFLKASGHQEDSQCTLADAEIITIALTAARFFAGNFETAMTMLSEQGYLPRRLSRGQFNQRLHRLSEVFEALFHLLARLFTDTNAEPHFILDSFPVAVCANIRIRRCRIYPVEKTEDAFRGYTSSKRQYFYGVKGHIMVNSEGLPLECFLTPGSASDTGQLKNFRFEVPKGSTIYGDKAYNEYLTEDLLEEIGIRLLPLRKKNSNRSVPAYVAYVQQHCRKKVETTISLLEQLLPKSIHAVTARGFELKVFLFVLACSFEGLY